MNLATVPTAELIRLAREKLEARLDAPEIFGELGQRYSYSAAPKEDRTLILEFDRTFVIPLLGRTKLPPGVIHLPGTKLPPVPEYYRVAAPSTPGIEQKSAPAVRKRNRDRGPDFFISYSGKDIQTARYLRDWLEQEGYSTFMQELDFPPSSHIVEKMEEGMRASRLLAVISDNYLRSDYCRAEFGAALMRDPLNRNARIVIARISKCEVPALWAPISRIELTSAGAHIRDVFLSGIAKLPKAGKRLTKKKPATASNLQAFSNSPATVSAQATAPGGVAAAAGRDLHFHYEGKPPRGRPKAPADVIDEIQATKLKQLFDEVVELDSGSPDGKGLDEGQLVRKWWGALGKAVPGSGYKNYSQSKFKRAMRWLRQHRARLASGAAEDEPAMAIGVMIRAIHTYISRNRLDKVSCYNEWSERLSISPPFASTKDLSHEDLKRVYGAMRRDSRSL